MSHLTIKSNYYKLTDRLNRFPQGAPASKLLFRILELLFSEREAGAVAQLPIKPFSVQKAAKIWKTDVIKSQKLLDKLASQGILVDIDNEGESIYVLPPPMAGFFEFSMMRIRKDIDQKLLSELFYQYLNVEEDFIKALFSGGVTKLGRAFIHEPVLSNDNSVYVLDYERASQVIETASHIGVGICYCRHKMEHLDRACDAPMEICMTFNTTAASLTKHKIARQIDKTECFELLQKAYDFKLVQFGENVQKRVNFICNCCGCCCEAMIAQRRFGNLHAIHTTNFIPVVENKQCNGCGKCVNTCPVEAMTLISANDPKQTNKKIAKLNDDICLGCGLCVKVCPNDGLFLKKRSKRVITPINGVHRTVLMAIERGKLHNLIFDNQVLWSHRALAAVLGVILKSPPLKQILANEQLKSRYVDFLISRAE